MGLRDQVRAFAARGATFRREFAGEEFIINGKPYCLASTGIRIAKEIDAGGLEVMPDATVRIDCRKYPHLDPAVKSSIFFGRLELMITGKSAQPLSGEIRLEVAKA